MLLQVVGIMNKCRSENSKFIRVYALVLSAHTCSIKYCMLQQGPKIDLQENKNNKPVRLAIEK